MELFKILGSIGVNNSEAIEKINETTEKAEESSSKFGSALSAIGDVAKKTALAVGTAMLSAAAGVGAITKSAVDGFAEYEQLAGGVETLFKDSSAIVMKYAEDAYKTAGLSANAYMETVTGFSASLIQSVGGDTVAAAELANQAITDMSDNANKMGTDIASIQNAYQGFAKQNYTMLDNLKLGYGGTKEEMERLLADAQAISGIEYDVSSYADVVSAIHVIQTEMGITGTTAKEASTTISGSIGTLKSSWTNFVSGLANPNSNLGKLINDMVSSAKTALGNLIPAVKTAMQGIGTAVTALAPIIEEELPGLIESILPSLLTAASSLVNGLLMALPSILSVLGSQLPSIFMNVFNTINSILPQLISSFVSVFSAIGRGLLDNLPTIINSFITLFTTLATQLFTPSNIQMFVEGVASAIKIIATSILNNLPLIVSTLMQLVANIFVALTDIIIEDSDDFLAGLGEILVTMGEAIWASLFSMLGIAQEDVGNFFASIFETTANFLGMTSSELSKGIQNILNFISNLKTKAINLAVDIFTSINNKLISFASKLISPIVTATTNILSKFESLKTSIFTKLASIKNKFVEIFDSVKTTVQNAINNIKEKFNFSWSLPKIKLPHFTVSGGSAPYGIGGQGSLPSISVSYYAKGGILDKVTPIGLTGNSLAVGGEAGKEAIIPLENDTKGIELIARTLQSNMDNGASLAILDKMNEILDKLDKLANMKFVMDTGATIGALARPMNAAFADMSIASERGERATWL